MVDVVDAQRLVTALPNGTDKTALQNQLDAMTEVNVLDEHQLDLALTTTNATTIVLAGPITTTTSYYGIAKEGVTIDGNGQTVTGQLRITKDNITLKNLTVDLAMSNPNTWVSGSFAVQVYGATGVTFDNVTFKNANVGLYVNSASVTVNNIKTAGNGFGGIGVAKSTTEVTTAPSLTVTGSNTHTDSADNPHIYTDGTDSSWVTATGYTPIAAGYEWEPGTTVKVGQIWYKQNQ